MTSISVSKLAVIKKLYFTDGWSAQEIARHFSVGLHTVYYFMRKCGMKRRSRAESNHAYFLRKPFSYQISSKLSQEEKNLKIMGVILYWAEGAKRGNGIDFTNSDVAMCKIFIRFLRQICGIRESKLRVYIYCHENQDQKFLIRFWSKELRIPQNQFTKPYVRRYEQERNDVKKRENRMLYGLVHIRYSDLRLLQQINTWIKEYYKNMGR